MPAGYGISRDPPEGSAEAWELVRQRIAGARSYWVATTRPDGRPHVMPVWGLWLDGGVAFATDRASSKARNAVANPAASIHLESGDDVVILEGELSELIDPALRQEFADEYETKYAFRPDPGSPTDAILVLRPRLVLSWLEGAFSTSATRWRFPTSPEPA